MAERRGHAFALQAGFAFVDAARCIGRQDQFQIDALGGLRRHRRQQNPNQRKGDSGPELTQYLPAAGAARQISRASTMP
jgi:hypothetical protein